MSDEKKYFINDGDAWPSDKWTPVSVNLPAPTTIPGIGRSWPPPDKCFKCGLPAKEGDVWRYYEDSRGVRQGHPACFAGDNHEAVNRAIVGEE